MWKVILSESILAIMGIISIIICYKKIDPNIARIYGVYVAIILILWLFVFLGLQQCYSV